MMNIKDLNGSKQMKKLQQLKMNNMMKYISKQWQSSPLVNKKWELYKNAMCCFEHILEATPHKTATVQPLTAYLTNHPSKRNKTWSTAVRARMNS